MASASIARAQADDEAARAAVRSAAASRSLMLLVPTSASLVVARLRELGEPAVLFGERPAHTRERLRRLLDERGIERGYPAGHGPEEAGGGDVSMLEGEEEDRRFLVGGGGGGVSSSGGVSVKPHETFYTEGAPDLLAARKRIAVFSLARARRRTKRQAEARRFYEAALRAEEEVGREKTEGGTDSAADSASSAGGDAGTATNGEDLSMADAGRLSFERDELLRKSYGVDSRVKAALRQQRFDRFVHVGTYSTSSEPRPLAFCSFSPQPSSSDQILLTAGWSSHCKIWRISRAHGTAELACTLSGAHEDRATSAVFHPHKGSVADFDSEGGALVLSTSGDMTAQLWRAGRVDTHAEAGVVRTFSEHRNRVNRGQFHPSGEFLATTSADRTWKLWDVESGVCVLTQTGHGKSVTPCSFQSDGSLLATGSADTTAKLWDLRSGRCIYTMRDHSDQVLSVDWSSSGFELATAGADNMAKIWDIRQRRNLYNIPAHSSLVNTVRYATIDLAPAQGASSMDSDRALGMQDVLVTAAQDRTVKIWWAKDFSLLRTLECPDGKIMSADIAPSGEFVAVASYDRAWRLFGAPSSSSLANSVSAQEDRMSDD
jgi:U4/U6 small nuclear ribonucleoprotein PRP4